MYRACLLSGFLVLAGAPTASAAVTLVPGTEFATSGWAGAAVYDESGSDFRACYMLRDFNGVGLVFTLDKQQNLSIGLKVDDWDFAEGATQNVRFLLDDWVDVEAEAVAQTPRVLLIAAGSGDDPIEVFRQGLGIAISGDIGAYELPLTGTSNALPALQGCVANVPDEPGAAPLTAEDRQAVRALALYEPDVRQAILDATLHPDVIAALGEIAEGSRTAFRGLVGELPRDSQQLVWDVVRYPAMLDTVVALGPSPSEEALRAAIADQPAEAQASLIELIESEPELAAQAHDIRLKAEEQVDDLLSSQPLQVESAFRIVIEQPEALAAMNERPDLVERIAAVYEKDPALVLARLEEVAQQIDAEYEESVQAWAQQLEANPEAAAQLVDASDEFTEQNDLPPSTVEASDPTTEVDVDVVVDTSAEAGAAAPGESAYGGELEPYPYYYGPPPGYDNYYPYQPQDYSGFYVNEVGELIVTGLMTYAFVDWLFDDDDDWWDRYPDLSSEVIVNVDRNNIWIGGGDDRVRDWIDDNRGDLPDGWFDNDGDLRDRMKDYADAHRDFDDWKGEGGDGKFADFLDDRGDRFPDLQKHRDKLIDGKGSSKGQLGALLQDKGAGGQIKDKVKGGGLLDGIDPGKKKEKLAGGGTLLKKDKELGGFLKQGGGGGDGKVKLKKKDKTKKVGDKKKRKQDGWNGKKKLKDKKRKG